MPRFKKIIFLDCDGVLNHAEFFKKTFKDRDLRISKWPKSATDPECVKNLKTILDRTGAGIVLSSSWRKCITLPDFRGLLKDFGIEKAPVIDTTTLSREAYDDHRGKEIQEWLDLNKPEVYIVIDDDVFDLTEHRPRHVHTSCAEGGLTAEKAEEAIKLLGEI